jgi:hypothetical protein
MRGVWLAYLLFALYLPSPGPRQQGVDRRQPPPRRLLDQRNEGDGRDGGILRARLASDIELIPIQRINEAYERMPRGDVRYRFVIDTVSLG